MNKQIQLLCIGLLGLASSVVATDVVQSGAQGTPQSKEIPVLDRDHFLTTKKVGYAVAGALTLGALSKFYKGLSTEEKRAAAKKILSSEHGGIIAGFSKRMDDPAVRAAFRCLLAGTAIGVSAAVLGYLVHNSLSYKITTSGLEPFEYIRKLRGESVNPKGNWTLAELEADAKKHGHGRSYNLEIKRIEQLAVQGEKSSRTFIDQLLNGQQVDPDKFSQALWAGQEGPLLNEKRAQAIKAKLLAAEAGSPGMAADLRSEENAFILWTKLGGELPTKQFPKMQALLTPQELASYRSHLLEIEKKSQFSLWILINDPRIAGVKRTPPPMPETLLVLAAQNKEMASVAAEIIQEYRVAKAADARRMANDLAVPVSEIPSASSLVGLSTAVFKDTSRVRELMCAKSWLPAGDQYRVKLDQKIASIRESAMNAFLKLGAAGSSIVL